MDQSNALTPDQMQQIWGIMAGFWIFIIAFILLTRVLAIWFF